MKNSYKAALLAAIGLVSISAAQAQTYTSGDLLVGFTTGSGTDLIYDLGQESALVNGETFSGLSTLLSSDFGSLSSVNWGVIGNGANSGSPRTLWTTTAVGVTPATVQGNPKFSALNNDLGLLAENFAGATSAGQSATVSATASTSWNVVTTPNATLSTDYINEYENPNVVGANSAAFSQVLNNGSTPTLLGDFTLGADDSFTFNTVSVPEPTTYGMIAAAGLLVVAFRNQFSRKQA